MDLLNLLLAQQLGAQTPSPMAMPSDKPVKKADPILDMMGRGPASDESPLQLKNMQMSGSIPAPSPLEKAQADYVLANQKGLEAQRMGVSDLEALMKSQQAEANPWAKVFAGASDLVGGYGNDKLQKILASEAQGKQQNLTNTQALQKAKNDITGNEVDLSKAQLSYEQQKLKDERDREQFKLLYGLKAQNAENSSEGKMFKQENSLFQDWQKNDTTKASQNVATGYEKVNAAVNNPSAAGDLSLVFGFMKMLDPGSVVRETEFKNAAEARAAMSRFESLSIPVPAFLVQGVQKLESGQFLLPEQRTDFGSQAKNVFKAQLEQQKRWDKTISQRAKAGGLNPEKIVFGKDLFGDAYDSGNVKTPMTRLEELRAKRGK